MLRSIKRFCALNASMCGTAPRLRAVRTAVVCSSWRAHAAAATALVAEGAPCLACNTDQHRHTHKLKTSQHVGAGSAGWQIAHLASQAAGQPAFGKHDDSHKHRQTVQALCMTALRPRPRPLQAGRREANFREHTICQTLHRCAVRISVQLQAAISLPSFCWCHPCIAARPLSWPGWCRLLLLCRLDWQASQPQASLRCLRATAMKAAVIPHAAAPNLPL